MSRKSIEAFAARRASKGLAPRALPDAHPVSVRDMIAQECVRCKRPWCNGCSAAVDEAAQRSKPTLVPPRSQEPELDRAHLEHCIAYWKAEAGRALARVADLERLLAEKFDDLSGG